MQRILDIRYSDHQTNEPSAPGTRPEARTGTGSSEWESRRGDPGLWQSLDVYRPPEDRSAELLPVVIFIHGGGLLQGDKSIYGPLGALLASMGFCAVVPNHRLAPEFPHPAHIEDVARAFAWVKRHIGAYGGDPERIAVVGHSSGGYLAGLLGLDPSYLGKHGLEPAQIAGLVPISGFFHVERLAPERPKSVWGRDPSRWPAASPATFATGDAPPTLLLYADGDTPARRQESEDLAQTLVSLGHRSVHAQQIAERDHFTIIQKFGTTGDATAQLTLAFLRQVLCVKANSSPAKVRAGSRE